MADKPVGGIDVHPDVLSLSKEIQLDEISLRLDKYDLRFSELTEEDKRINADMGAIQEEIAESEKRVNVNDTSVAAKRHRVQLGETKLRLKRLVLRKAQIVVEKGEIEKVVKELKKNHDALSREVNNG
jgi:chromosome segregation ATPase